MPMKVFPALIFVLQWNVYFTAEEYVITRNVDWNFKDTFRLPSSECNGNWRQKCVKYGARRWRQKCVCVCNQNNRFAFGNLRDQWKCLLSSSIRTSGCKSGHRIAILSGIDNATPLMAVRTDSNERYIGHVDQNASTCHLNKSLSYLDCSGTWQRFNQDATIGFNTIFVADDIDSDVNYFWLRMHPQNELKKYSPRLKGKILKFNVLCTNEWLLPPSWTLCIFLKIYGQQTCPTHVPTTTTTTTTTTMQTTATTTRETSASKSITTSSSTHSTTTPSSTTSSTELTSTTAQTVSNTRPTAQPAQPSQKQFAPKTETPRRTKTSYTNENSAKGPFKGGDDESVKVDKSAIIAGPIGGVAALITIIIIVIFLRVWMKRKKRRTSNGVAQNAVYDGVVLDNHNSRPPGQLPSADDEYSYAYMNTHPVFIKNENGTALQSRHLSNGHAGNMQTASGPPPDSTSPIYNTLEDPDYANLNTAKEAPYNVLERQPEAGWKMPPNSESPVNNTLEDPSYAKINKTNKKQQGGGSSYNVLERGPLAKRNQQNEPFYDALEKPKSTSGLTKTSEAPIYNTLEDPNYAALKRTDDFGDKQSSNGVINESPYYDVLENPNSTQENPIYNTLEDPNSSQESPVYNVLEGPSTTSSPVYAELENPESEENHVYGDLQNYDPHIYGALNSPTSTNGDFDYNDDYNNIGDVIYHNKGAVDSDVYQELNANGQSSMEEQYEPLRHSNMFIDMKELNGEGQSHA